MGLKEKRIINNLQESDIPFHQSNFKSIAGTDLTVDIDWDEWSTDADGLLNLNGYVLQQFTDSLNQIGLDAAAKEALADGIKTVKVVRAQMPDERSVVLENGTLTLTVAPSAGWDGVVPSGTIKDHLLDNL